MTLVIMTQLFIKRGSFPISGLVDGTTYFVKNRTATSFQLSETSEEVLSQ